MTHEVLARVDPYSLDNIDNSSVGSRLFHADYGVSLLRADLIYFLAGVGPGMYGIHAAETGIFPESVTPQLVPIEIFVEVGILGLAASVAVISLVVRRLVVLGVLGIAGVAGLLIATTAQADWRTAPVFFAFGFLLGVAESTAEARNPMSEALEDSEHGRRRHAQDAVREATGGASIP